jgi:ADP-ribose pyrophosphatase
MKGIKILTRKKMYDRFFGVDELEIQFDDDPNPVKRSLVVTKDASGILLHNTDNDTIIFSKQHRMGAIDHDEPYVIEIPAGVLDAGELPEACAKREVLEETGYGINSLQKIGSFYASPGYTNEKINLFYCTTNSQLKHNMGGGLEGEHEFIEIIEMPLLEALSKIDTGEICDAKTVIGLLWLAKCFAA